VAQQVHSASGRAPNAGPGHGRSFTYLPSTTYEFLRSLTRALERASSPYPPRESARRVTYPRRKCPACLRTARSAPNSAARSCSAAETPPDIHAQLRPPDSLLSIDESLELCSTVTSYHSPRRFDPRHRSNGAAAALGDVGRKQPPPRRRLRRCRGLVPAVAGSARWAGMWWPQPNSLWQTVPGPRRCLIDLADNTCGCMTGSLGALPFDRSGLVRGGSQRHAAPLLPLYLRELG